MLSSPLARGARRAVQRRPPMRTTRHTPSASAQAPMLDASDDAPPNKFISIQQPVVAIEQGAKTPSGDLASSCDPSTDAEFAVNMARDDKTSMPQDHDKTGIRDHSLPQQPGVEAILGAPEVAMRVLELYKQASRATSEHPAICELLALAAPSPSSLPILAGQEPSDKTHKMRAAAFESFPLSKLGAAITDLEQLLDTSRTSTDFGRRRTAWNSEVSAAHENSSSLRSTVGILSHLLSELEAAVADEAAVAGIISSTSTNDAESDLAIVTALSSQLDATTGTSMPPPPAKLMGKPQGRKPNLRSDERAGANATAEQAGIEGAWPLLRSVTMKVCGVLATDANIKSDVSVASNVFIKPKAAAPSPKGGPLLRANAAPATESHTPDRSLPALNWSDRSMRAVTGSMSTEEANERRSPAAGGVTVWSPEPRPTLRGTPPPPAAHLTFRLDLSPVSNSDGFKAPSPREDLSLLRSSRSSHRETPLQSPWQAETTETPRGPSRRTTPDVPLGPRRSSATARRGTGGSLILFTPEHEPTSLQGSAPPSNPSPARCLRALPPAISPSALINESPKEAMSPKEAVPPETAMLPEEKKPSAEELLAPGQKREEYKETVVGRPKLAAVHSRSRWQTATDRQRAQCMSGLRSLRRTFSIDQNFTEFNQQLEAQTAMRAEEEEAPQRDELAAWGARAIKKLRSGASKTLPERGVIKDEPYPIAELEGRAQIAKARAQCGHNRVPSPGHRTSAPSPGLPTTLKDANFWNEPSTGHVSPMGEPRGTTASAISEAMTTLDSSRPPTSWARSRPGTAQLASQDEEEEMVSSWSSPVSLRPPGFRFADGGLVCSPLGRLANGPKSLTLRGAESCMSPQSVASSVTPSHAENAPKEDCYQSVQYVGPDAWRFHTFSVERKPSLGQPCDKHESACVGPNNTREAAANSRNFRNMLDLAFEKASGAPSDLDRSLDGHASPPPPVPRTAAPSQTSTTSQLPSAVLPVGSQSPFTDTSGGLTSPPYAPSRVFSPPEAGIASATPPTTALYAASSARPECDIFRDALYEDWREGQSGGVVGSSGRQLTLELLDPAESCEPSAEDVASTVPPPVDPNLPADKEAAEACWLKADVLPSLAAVDGSWSSQQIVHMELPCLEPPYKVRPSTFDCHYAVMRAETMGPAQDADWEDMNELCKVVDGSLKAAASSESADAPPSKRHKAGTEESEGEYTELMLIEDLLML